MASSPAQEEGAEAHSIVSNNISGAEGSTMARPARLRVARPDVDKVLRCPRSGRPKKSPPPSQVEQDEEYGERARYDCVFREEGKREFVPPELVWGKVRRHPWWPGQVFDAADASELAMQHRKEGALLVAYLWDKTFAWVEPSALLPFCSSFARLAGQSTMFGFVSAVDAALCEISRRLEAGLSCGCFGSSVAKKQEFENAGVREGAYGAVVDAAYMRDSFRGEAFLDYISALGRKPLAGADRLDLTIAKAQLTTFNQSRGLRGLPEFVMFEGIEDVANVVPLSKRKRMEKGDGDYDSSKEKLRRGESMVRKQATLLESANEVAMDEDNGRRIRGAKGDALSKERKSRHCDNSVHKKKHISEDGEGPGDGSAADSPSPGEHGGNSVAKDVLISGYGRKKKKLSELMVDKDTRNPATGGKGKARRKLSLHASKEELEDPDLDLKGSAKNRKKKKLDTLRDLESKSQPLSSKKFTKIGELMFQAAEQMSQTPPVLKSNGSAAQAKSRKSRHRQGKIADEPTYPVKAEKGEKGAFTEDLPLCDELLSWLSIAACDLKRGMIEPTIINFFTVFRNSRVSSSLDKVPEKAVNIECTPSEMTIPDHMQDSYWAGILVNVEEPLANLRKKKTKVERKTRKKAHQSKKHVKQSLESLENVEEPRGEIDQGLENGKQNGVQKKAETKHDEVMEDPLLAGLVLNFSNPSAVPSGSDLVKIFSQYGPVKESRTEIATNANCAQVIFKRHMDAEAAFAGAGKISALGPALISFRLTDFPSAAPNEPPWGTSRTENGSPPIEEYL